MAHDGLICPPSGDPFTGTIRSIHVYPYVMVIEKAEMPVERFCSQKHGTEWQPFL